jgi:hypothetical protein
MMLLITTLGASLAADAAPDFTPMIQVRPRVEANSGKDGAAEEGNMMAVSQRTRLGAKAKFGDLKATVVFQDVRLWGMESHTLTDFSADFVDAHIAKIVWKPAKEVAFTFGRQEFSVHEQRLIAAANWTQQGRAFDGARIWLGSGGISADLAGYLMNEGDLIHPDAKDDGLMVLRAGYGDRDAGATADVVAIVEMLGDQRQAGTIEIKRQTLGAYAKGKTGILSGRVEAYYQLGDVGDGAASIGAYMAGLSATVAPEASVKPTITLWYDHLSGDDNVADNEVKAFNTLYGANHKFYGLMDMAAFTTGAMVDGRGLQDIAIKLGLRPIDGLTTHLDIHQLMPADTQGGDSAIAQEADLWVSYKISKHLKVSGGTAAWMPADDSDMDFWSWLMLDANL